MRSFGLKLLHLILYRLYIELQYSNRDCLVITVQVAALAPLALLLVLEARCAHFVIAHLNNMSNASLLPHIYILYMMTNLHRRLLQRCEWTLP